MTVEVWYGDKSHNDAERRTVLELYQFLRSQQEHFVLLHNFFAGHSNEIDLIVLKSDGVFLAELKHVWDRIMGRREGEWKAIREDGSEVILNPDRPNPFKQVQHNYYGWKEWCEGQSEEISAGLSKTKATDWTDVMSYVVLHPDLPAGSNIDIGDWPVQALGLPAFLLALLSCSSRKVDLSRQEMSRIPQLIGMKRWRALDPTKKLSDWQPASFAVLVARGHALSVPLFRLDEVEKRTISIGRDPENDLIIGDPAVSRRHAELYQYEGRWVVRDLDSTSGTFVSYTGTPDEERPASGREFALRNSSIVRFGPASYTLVVYEGNAS